MRLLDRILPVGSRSVLWGAHCFFIHPIFVAIAWFKLYGWPDHLAIWVAFFVHDLGYWSKIRMDDADGERHVEWGAYILTFLFDSDPIYIQPGSDWIVIGHGDDAWFCGPWGQFSLFHSRYYAKRHNKSYSRLCVADKLAIALEPWWLYLPRVWASGELHEYLSYARGHVETNHGDAAGSDYAKASATPRGWHKAMTDYCRKWAYAHRDGVEDTWTKAPKSV